MGLTVCEKGKICVYLKKVVVRGSGYERLDYLCNNPKRFKEYQLPKILKHNEKYGYCKAKITDRLTEFF